MTEIVEWIRFISWIAVGGVVITFVITFAVMTVEKFAIWKRRRKSGKEKFHEYR